MYALKPDSILHLKSPENHDFKCKTLAPGYDVQSLSLLMVQEDGQQPSLFAHDVIATCLQLLVVSQVSVVHEFLSSHCVGLVHFG